MEIKIYVLIDPFTLKTRYIGRTRKPLNTRLSEHVSKAKNYKKYGRRNTHTYSWINSLLKVNSRPYIKLLTTVNGWEESHEVERHLIKKYKTLRDLTNHDDFGAGEAKKIINKDTAIRVGLKLSEMYKSGELVSTSCKEVHVYNLDGDYIKSFFSIKQAGKELNIHHGKITEQLGGKFKQIKKYRFSLIKHDKLDKMLNPKGNRSIINLMFNNGEEIVYSSMQECLTAFNINSQGTGTSPQLVTNRIFGKIETVSRVFINNLEYFPRYKDVKITVQEPDGSILLFDRLQYLGEHYNISPSKCYLAKLIVIFKEKYPNHKLIIDSRYKTP